MLLYSNFQDWSLYDYVVIPNLNIFSSYDEMQYADTIYKLFR